MRSTKNTRVTHARARTRVTKTRLAPLLVSTALFTAVVVATNGARAEDTSPPAPSPAPTGPLVPADAGAPAEDPAVAALREEVAALRAKQEALEARVTAEEKKKPLVVVSGLVHADWVLDRQSSQDEVSSEGQPLNENRFVIRRARLRAESDQGYFHGALMIDANTIKGPEVRPYNIEGSAKYPADRPYPVEPLLAARDTKGDPYVVVTAGLLLTPFGYEVQEMDYTRPFLERSAASQAMFPTPFDLGLRVLGGWQMLNWQLGVMNGHPIGDAVFPGRDPTKSKDLLFRLGATTEIVKRLVRVEAGVSGLTGHGFHEGNPAAKDQLVYHDYQENGTIELPNFGFVAGSAATPSQNFDRFAIGADARVEVTVPGLGVFAARTELVRAKNLDRGTYVADPVAAGRDIREDGWYVGATQEVTRWGMLGVRYDLYNPDSDAQIQQPFALVPADKTTTTWSLLAALRFAPRARLVAQYDIRKNMLGLDAAGNPTTLADNSFTLRAEARF